MTGKRSPKPKGSGKRAKVRAGGPLRRAADTTWKTPEFVLERVRVAHGGAIPFDPASALDNPTKADRYCAGPPGTLFAAAAAAAKVEPLQRRIVGFEEEGKKHAPVALVHAGHDPACECERCRLVCRSGLEADWNWPWWCNPPFNEEWIRKIGREAKRRHADDLLSGTRGIPGLALLPCNRQEEPFFHEMFEAASLVCYVDAKPFQPTARSRPSRIAFISSVDGVACDNNPFASVILGFNFDRDRFMQAFLCLGACYEQKLIGPTSSRRQETSKFASAMAAAQGAS
jgi:hypothetical protein